MENYFNTSKTHKILGNVLQMQLEIQKQAQKAYDYEKKHRAELVDDRKTLQNKIVNLKKIVEKTGIHAKREKFQDELDECEKKLGTINKEISLSDEIMANYLVKNLVVDEDE